MPVALLCIHFSKEWDPQIGENENQALYHSEEEKWRKKDWKSYVKNKWKTENLRYKSTGVKNTKQISWTKTLDKNQAGKNVEVEKLLRKKMEYI